MAAAADAAVEVLGLAMRIPPRLPISAAVATLAAPPRALTVVEPLVMVVAPRPRLIIMPPRPGMPLGEPPRGIGPPLVEVTPRGEGPPLGE